ncbi:MAG: sodium:solute symporter [Bacteroidetes bacterium]|jgi:Na+/proline symporter|nr:sodium:solute symporter [Bacteroidota bacterium]
MQPELILALFLGYTVLLFAISIITSRKATNESYYLGNRQSPWPVVAYGMVGASLSGVTFISIPGWVGNSQFSYMMVVFGYIVGYAVISMVLLPLYYNLKLTSIYTYLEKRFGFWSYKSGAFYFIVSRLIGASFRMFLVVNVLQLFIFDHYNVPFWLTVALFMLLITLYSFKGGIKTIVWTDMLQTTFMLTALIVTLFIILNKMELGLSEMIGLVKEEGYAQIVITDWRHDRFYLKQFFSGMFITIVMTGLDQDMMQKNLSCRNLKDAQKNMTSLSLLLVPANLLFLFLGASLFVYANHFGVAIPQLTDNLFPELAINHFGLLAGVVFFIGLIAAAYSSADSAITALTTSVSVDFLGVEKQQKNTGKSTNSQRYIVHFAITSIILLIIVLFREINNQAVIARLFTIAGYTYGPLLGLYAFGLFTKHQLKDRFVPLVVLLAPLLTYFIDTNSSTLFNGYNFGFELLILNGLLTYTGLWIIKKRLLIKTTS